MNETFQNIPSVYKQNERNKAAREWHTVERRRKKTHESRRVALARAAVGLIQECMRQQSHERDVVVLPEQDASHEEILTMLDELKRAYNMTDPIWREWLATIERAMEKNGSGEYAHSAQAEKAEAEIISLHQALKMRESGARDIQEWMKKQAEKSQSDEAERDPKKRQSLVKSLALVAALFAGAEAVQVEVPRHAEAQQDREPGPSGTPLVDVLDIEKIHYLERAKQDPYAILSYIANFDRKPYAHEVIHVAFTNIFESPIVPGSIFRAIARYSIV